MKLWHAPCRFGAARGCGWRGRGAHGSTLRRDGTSGRKLVCDIREATISFTIVVTSPATGRFARLPVAWAARGRLLTLALRCAACLLELRTLEVRGRRALTTEQCSIMQALLHLRLPLLQLGFRYTLRL